MSKKNHNTGNSVSLHDRGHLPLAIMALPGGIKKHFVLCISFFLLYLLADTLSSSIQIVGVSLKFYDLTLPVISALLVLYSFRALPTLGLFALYSFCSHPLSHFLYTIAQLMAALTSYTIYFYAAGKRSIVSFGRSQLSAQRIIWMICVNTIVFTLLHQLILQKSHFFATFDEKIWSIPTLISMQWMMTSCLTGIPFCYLILRACYKPVWFFSYLKQLKEIIIFGPKAIYQIVWILLLVGLMCCLVYIKRDNIIFTDYSLVWLLPVMLWGAICLGHALIAPLWVLMLILLSDSIDNYITLERTFTVDHYIFHLALASSVIFVFSLTIVIVGVMTTRIRKYIRHLKRISLSEPHTGLPNLQALKNDIIRLNSVRLCMLQCPELNTLTQNHGIAFRFEFVKAVVRYLNPLLSDNEKIYYSPGYGILLRLDSINVHRIDSYYQAMSAFRFSWEEMKLGLNFGIAHTVYDQSVNNLSHMVGLLNASTFISLQQGKPEALNLTSGGDDAMSTGVIRHYLQKSIDRQSFVLVAQPIVSTKGHEKYHEVLIRMKMAGNKLCFPNTFLPLAYDAGLLAEVDMAVIEQTFRFMDSLDEDQANSRFSINLTPQSLIKSDFQDRLYALFKAYSIRPDRIIFEIIESDIIDSINASRVLRELRKLGCKIAIDDFGTGESSYLRLKNLEADILKIDGSFIRNVVENEFDRFTVMSFCEAANFKNLEVVAEFVENEEIEQMLVTMGVGWLQGYHTGKPAPIESLF